MFLSPRCGARTRSGSPCRQAAMPNGRCRIHGGKSPGAPRGSANGLYRHGRFTCEAIETRRMLNRMVREMRALAREIV
ncbi:HGGxSTG domain-containing protein [Enterovirga sp.]|uniref:HGGxSTG domain-containing protein n=1 Tax=Enterovirga sp. TaxID=2026350 RepID=UPI002C66C119|nr:HGGxSTG domain-containing protein [Enterovirga sp.]HMO31052.1 HGGxSTG domain-containing protein [Enterovirga sp.]